MKRKSMGANAVLSAVKTALGVIFPLITFPYATRTLGAENVGRFDFASSAVSYAVLLSALGFRMYAIRECSRVRGDRKSLEEMGSSIFTINVVSSVAAYVILAALCVFVPKLRANWILIAILSLEIAFTTVGCEWVYTVFEDFLYITVRYLCIHLVSLVLLFCFVRTQEDLVKYTILSVGALGAACVANVVGRRRYCRIRLTRHVEAKTHLPPIMVFFFNNLSTTIYVNSDRLILGFMTSYTYTGLYYVAARIYSIVKSILASVINVAVPRLSEYWSENAVDKVKETCGRIFSVLLILSVPAMAGLITLSRQIVLLLSGAEYERSYVSLAILGVALLVAVFSWFYKNCILIPAKHEKKVMAATVTAAAVNIVLNLILIPFFQEKAAAFTTVVAEAISLTMMLLASRKVLRIRVSLREVLTVLGGSALIVLICKTAEFLAGENPLLIIVTAIPASVLSYGAVLLLAKNPYALAGLAAVGRKAKQILKPRGKDRE